MVNIHFSKWHLWCHCRNKKQDVWRGHFLFLCPVLGTLAEGKLVAYIISVLFRNLWDACRRCNEPVEMQVCKLSVGLEKLKFHNLLSMLKSNNWFMDTMGPSRNSCTCLFEKLELHVALCNRYAALVPNNLLSASITWCMHASHEPIIKINGSRLLVRVDSSWFERPDGHNEQPKRSSWGFWRQT